jgi:hypothetical protein
MLVDVFSIKVMSSIFKYEAFDKLGLKAKLVYQNILENHFSMKEESVANLVSFSIKSNSIPNFIKFKDTIIELEDARLVEYDTYSEEIVFLQVWMKYINLSRLSNAHKEISPSEFKEEIRSSREFIELIAMKHRITLNEVIQLVDLFFLEQGVIGKKYVSEHECRKHFLYWTPHNLNKVIKEKVVSMAKILGQTNS